MPSVFRGNDNFDTAGGNAVKAWVNFNGTGTVAIRANFNVSSITDNGVGDYTVNFANALVDDNYSVIGTAFVNALTNSYSVSPITYLAGSIKLRHFESGALADTPLFNVAIFR